MACHFEVVAHFLTQQCVILCVTLAFDFLTSKWSLTYTCFVHHINLSFLRHWLLS